MGSSVWSEPRPSLIRVFLLCLSKEPSHSHYRNMKMLDGSVQFGSGKGQVKCFFKWGDPFSKENKTSYSCKF